MFALVFFVSFATIGSSNGDKVSCAQLNGTTWIAAQDTGRWTAISVDFVQSEKKIAKINGLYNRNYVCEDDEHGAQVVIKKGRDEQLVIRWMEPHSDKPRFQLKRTVTVVHGSMEKPVAGNEIEVDKAEHNSFKAHELKNEEKSGHKHRIESNGEYRHKEKSTAVSETTQAVITETVASQVKNK